MSVYTEAIGVLEERGWYQGGAEGPDGAVCLVSALTVASLRLGMGTKGGCLGWLRIVTGRTGLGAWNDDPRTTYEDVVLALKRADEMSNGF